MERRKVAVWTGLVVTGLVVASCLVMAGNVTADPGPGMVEQGFKPQSEFQNPEEFRSSQGNNPGDANLPGGIDAKQGQLNAGQTKPSGIKAWFIDHGKGLGLGLLEGAGIALGVVALGALGVLAAPVAGIAAVGALAGCAIYGAITGADRFNPWECAVNGVIGAVSAGLGATVAAGSKLVTTVVNSVGGGIASTAGYLLNDPNPTLGGALAAFGLGAGTAGLMTIGGEWLSKTQVYQKSANLLHIGTRATKAASAVGQSLDDASTRSVSTNEASMASEAVEATGTARSEVAERLWSTGRPVEAIQPHSPTRPPFVQSPPFSRTLKKNLLKAGNPRPVGSAAHHVVAGTEPRAAEARAVLERFEIDINDASNGIFLPHLRRTPGPAYHRTLHTDVYYDRVNRLLRQATTKDEVLETLEAIRQDLSVDRFPH